jgi:hypothetical protein
LEGGDKFRRLIATETTYRLNNLRFGIFEKAAVANWPVWCRTIRLPSRRGEVVGSLNALEEYEPTEMLNGGPIREPACGRRD